jgi:putative tricarboxylic transport membrane protein
MTRANAGDVASGLVLAVAGAAIVVTARGWEYTGSDGPGAGFFPLWYGIAMVALAAALIGSALSRRAAAVALERPRSRRPILTWVAFALAVAALKPLGFVLSYGLLSFFLVRFVHAQSLAKAAAVAIAGAAVFYLIFDVALGVSLPRGPVGF